MPNNPLLQVLDGPTVADPNRNVEGFPDARVSTGLFTRTAFDAAWHTNPSVSIARWLERKDAGEIEDLDGLPMRTLMPEELNKRYGLSGKLKFERPLTEAQAQMLYETKRQELGRQGVLSLGGGGFMRGAQAFGAGLTASIMDPLNIAASMIPIVGEGRVVKVFGHSFTTARFAGLARAAKPVAEGGLGSTTARLGAGALEGGVGNALIEPVVYGVAKSEQADYDMYDSLTNIVFGMAIGGGIQVGVGKLKDVFQRPIRGVQLHPETHDAMVRGAMAQGMEGRPVDVAKVAETDINVLRQEAEKDPAITQKYAHEFGTDENPVYFRATGAERPVGVERRALTPAEEAAMPGGAKNTETPLGENVTRDFGSARADAGLTGGVEAVRPLPDAKILREKDIGFDLLIKKVVKEGMTPAERKAAILKEAFRLGYDAVEFRDQRLDGTVIMNQDAFERQVGLSKFEKRGGRTRDEAASARRADVNERANQIQKERIAQNWAAKKAEINARAEQMQNHAIENLREGERKQSEQPAQTILPGNPLPERSAKAKIEGPDTEAVPTDDLTKELDSDIQDYMKEFAPVMSEADKTALADLTKDRNSIKNNRAIFDEYLTCVQGQ